MKLNACFNPFEGLTAISNVFIDNYFGSVNPTYIMVYLYLYRHSQSGMPEMQQVSRDLNLLESDIVNSLRFWHKEGIIRLNETEGIEVEFLPIEPKEPENEPTRIIMQSRPQYSVMELEIYKSESTEISRLFSVAEQAMGKYLTSNDLSVLFGLYDWLRLPLKVIELLLEYCSENGHRNIRYIEKVGIDWAENGIDTVEKAQEYIKMFNVEYQSILKAYGQSGRTATPAEIKYMKKWLKTFETPLEIVLEACDRTILQTGQAKLSYTDKILTEWHEKGIKTLEQVKLDQEEFIKSRKKDRDNPAGTKKPVAKPNRFINFKQREWDYNKIEELERKYLQDSIGDSVSK